MPNIRSVNEIILNLIDYFKLVQPDASTNPGSVIRDLFIDAPASQFALLYDELSTISTTQSLRLSVGSDLDKLAKNFGIVRRRSSASTGAVLFTFSSINSTININQGDSVFANNGSTFSVATGVSVIPAALNLYRSIASKFRDQLDSAGISDTLAVQVTVNATSPGTSGNIGTYSINKTNITGVSNVTNVNSFNGGTDQESDAAFRNRILSAFSGSSVGTTLGYLNVAISTTGVADVAIIQPGDPLMTRDGTIVSIASDGTRTIVSEGSGGKVDVVVLGSNLIDNSDSFIYTDKSNNNDPSNVKNNVILGQIVGDENKTIKRKRIDNIKNGVLPAQPVQSILQVSGSTSGSNFVEKTIDSYGRVSGNFELLKDAGVYGGSPFGFDTFHWINNKISLFSEDKIKGQLNSQDALTFKDVLEIPTVQQNLSITNENSTVTFDQSIIQLLHTPATNVTRVFNVNTGERYLITNQNLDQTGAFNTTGRIKISGNTLPSPSDQLQVDYNWVVSYDQYSDYDGLVHTNNPRTSIDYNTDSVDWGYGALVRDEKVLFTRISGNNYFLGSVESPIDSVISVIKSIEVDSTVVSITSGTFVNRKAVKVELLPEVTNSINSIILKNSNKEVYNTAQANGLFTVSTQIVGINTFYVVNIILPTDTVANVGDSVTVLINSNDIYHSDTEQGSSNNNQITIPSSLVNTIADNIYLSATYLSNISNTFTGAVSALPASRVGNGFTLSNNNGFNNLNIANISRSENQVVQQNLSNQYYIDISLPNADFSLLNTQVVSVVRLSDGYELWSSNHLGTIAVGSTDNYQIILSGFNNPAIGDRVLAIYYATDTKRFQPFSYSNSIIKHRVDKLSLPITNKLSVPLNNINIPSLSPALQNITFYVLEPNTDIVLATGTDGYFTYNSPGTANFSSYSSVNFATLYNLVNKKIKIVTPSVGLTNCNNDGLYDIISYNSNTNNIVISNILSNITSNQVSAIRLLDGKDIWNSSCSIDFVNNRLLIPLTSAAAENDSVFVSFFNFKNLKQSPTRIVGNTVDQIINVGVLTVNGTTLSKVDSVIFTATNAGLKLNLSEAVKKALSISSSSIVPSNLRLAKLIKAERVITASSTDDTVLETLAVYDTVNTTIKNNLLYSEMLDNSSLLPFDFILPNTSNNNNNLPALGDKIKVTFYYVTDNDSENLSYTRNGTLYTNKKFALINRIFISSGFKSSTATRFTAAFFNQPGLGARYKSFYDYTAPKQNERITVKYNYNKLISDVTFSIEGSRPINADVLARSAKETLLDLTMNVVIDPAMISSTDTILQNLRSQLIDALTTNKLTDIIDQTTLINIAQSVSGISRARILYFNKHGNTGSIIKFQAQSDEYFSSNNVIINTETR